MASLLFVSSCKLANFDFTLRQRDSLYNSTPSVTIDSAPNILYLTYTNYTLSGSCTHDGEPVVVNVGGVSKTVTCSGTSWSASLNMTSVADATGINVTADHQNGAGETATQVSTTVDKDIIPPVGLTQTLLIDSSTVTDRVNTASGACEDGATVHVTGDIESDIGPFQIPCFASGWIIQFAMSRGDGAKSIVFDQQDAAGNWQVSSVDHSYTFDRRELIKPLAVAGVNNAVFIDSDDGRVLTSGDNFYGLLGNDLATLKNYIPQVIDMSSTADSNSFSVAAISARRACAVHTNMKIYCWGYSGGFLGNGGTSTEYTPVEVDMSGHVSHNNNFNFVSMNTENDTSCAIHDDANEVFCWGDNSNGQLGDGTTVDQSSPVLIDTTSAGITNSFLHVSVGMDQTCAIHETGKVYCWGIGTSGGLGNASTSNSLVPVEIDMSTHGLYDNDFVALSQNNTEGDMCALHSSGKVYCWGVGIYGSLGDGAGVDRSSPVEIDMSGVVEENVFISLTNNCAVQTNLKGFCWGRNFYGRVPVGNETDQLSPVEVDMGTSGKSNEFRIISAGRYMTVAEHDDGTLLSAGRTVHGGVGTGVVDYNTNFSTLSFPASSSGIFTDLSLGGSSSCAIDSDGEVYCWGSSYYGLMGNGSSSGDDGHYGPVEIDMSTSFDTTNDFTKISLSNDHVCGIHSTGRLYCWGRNNRGMLGIGSTTDQAYPQVVMSGTTFVDVAVNELDTCAIETGGKVYCWGYNGDGQIGDGSTTSSTSPVEISLGEAPSNNFTQISGSSGGVCAVHTSQAIYCWGDLGYGLLGDSSGGAGTDQLDPAEISMGSTGVANTFTEVQNHRYGACGLHTNGKVYCWGRSNYVGRSVATKSVEDIEEIDMSVAPADATGFIKLSVNGFTDTNNNSTNGGVGVEREFAICAHHSSNRTYCWGDTSFDPVFGIVGASQTPIEVTSDAVVSASANRATCIIDSSGSVLCTGDDVNGRQGDAAHTHSFTSFELVDPTNF